VLDHTRQKLHHAAAASDITKGICVSERILISFRDQPACAREQMRVCVVLKSERERGFLIFACAHSIWRDLIEAPAGLERDVKEVTRQEKR